MTGETISHVPKMNQREMVNSMHGKAWGVTSAQVAASGAGSVTTVPAVQHP